jgi:hypothetical protein
MYGSSNYGSNNPPSSNNPPLNNPPLSNNPPLTSNPSFSNNPPLTNNPFIQNASDPSSRYPDISPPPFLPQSQSQWTVPTTGSQSQYQSDIYQRHPTVQQQQFPLGYTPQPPQFQSPQPPQIQPPNYTSPYQQPLPQQGLPYYSNFGQPKHSVPVVSIGGQGYPPSGQPPPQQTTPAYNPAQQQLNNPNYVPQFDSYGQIPKGWDTDTATPQSQEPFDSTDDSHFGHGKKRDNQNNNNNLGFSPSGDPHPRDYIRSHKQEIEDWDPYTWKQLLNSCEALKTSWESKRNELRTNLAGLQSQHRYAGYYDRTQIQHQGDRIQAVS